jgi:hypothetical protein
MRNVDLDVGGEIVLEIERLTGGLEPTRRGSLATLDDPESFLVRIEEAEILIGASSLEALLNNEVFAYEGAPLTALRVSFVDGRLRQEGRLRGAAGIPFALEGELSPSAEGDIRLQPTAVSVAGLPVGGLMDLFDVEMEEVLDSNQARGFRVVEDTIVFDPERMVPAPVMRGEVVALRIDERGLHQTLRGERAPRPGIEAADGDAANFMFFAGGRLRFGKLTMAGTDLQIVDRDPKDPFHFAVRRWNEQLVAGYSRTLPDRGLLVVMPDHDDVAGAGVTER